jgi:chromosome partitioning protein
LVESAGGGCPDLCLLEVVRLTAYMAELRQQRVNLVVIDTPPALLHTIRAAILVADLVLIPARPSPHDLRAVGVVVEMAEQARKRFCFVVNDATPRTTIALEAVQALAQHGPVAPVVVHQRIDFAGSMVDGRTVREITPPSRSADEITQLCKYVYT